jgi:hypothetical protein
MTTLEKIKCLEEYVAINNSVVDSVIEITINKLLAREFERVSELKARLINDISEFEKQYVLKSDDFYEKYEKGALGDSMDFVEWAATVEMLENVKRQHKLLESSVY